MDFVCFTVPGDSFPRFDNAYTKSLQLQSRFNILHSKPNKKSVQQEYRYINVYLCKESNETEFPVEINTIIAETIKDSKFDTGKIITLRNINSFLKTREEKDSNICLLVVDSKNKKELNKLVQTNIHIIVVAEDNLVKTKLENKLQGQSSSNITVAKKESISSEIDNVLERIALAPLKQIGENCYGMMKLKSSTAANSTGYPSAELSKLSQTGNKYNKIDTSNGSSLAETPTSRRNGYLPGQMHTTTEKKPSLSQARNGCTVHDNFDPCLGKGSTKTNKHKKESEANKTNVSSHVSTTIYARSSTHLGSVSMLNDLKTDTVPVTNSLGRKETKGIVRKRTVETDTDSTLKVKRRKTELSDQMGLSDTVYPCSSGGQLQEEENPERLLESILALYDMSNVPETEIPDVPKHSNKVSEEMRKELFKISPTVKRMGYMNDGEGHCGLISKHVSEYCSDVYYVAKGNNKWIGPMLEATNKHQHNALDISAAKIDEPIGGDGTQFKDTRQKLLKGKLYEYTENEEDAICKSGQAVHIYGAKSNPGKGEITMPFVDMELSTTLIQVEDEINKDGTPKGRFAEKGDSGAIVCVEDPDRKDVHVLSMLMGTQDLEDSPSTRRTYLTIPLSKGLQQLENDTGKKFKLY